MSRVKLINTAKRIIKKNENRDYSPEQLDEVLTAFIDGIAEMLDKGDPVTIRFFGSFLSEGDIVEAVLDFPP